MNKNKYMNKEEYKGLIEKYLIYCITAYALETVCHEQHYNKVKSLDIILLHTYLYNEQYKYVIWCLDIMKYKSENLEQARKLYKGLNK